MTASKVAVLGASGHVGSEIIKQLHMKGIPTLAVSRDASKIPSYSNVIPIQCDATNITKLAPKLMGIKTLVSALRFDVPTEDILNLAKQAGADRVVVVGMAGSLRAQQNGPLLMESPDFPPQYLVSAQNGIQMLKDLQTVEDFDWLFISPPLNFGTVPSTGHYRVRHDDVLLLDKNNHSQISYADYALGLVDEIVTPHYHQQRISIGQ